MGYARTLYCFKGAIKNIGKCKAPNAQWDNVKQQNSKWGL